jgi:hypothetical protein
VRIWAQVTDKHVCLQDKTRLKPACNHEAITSFSIDYLFQNIMDINIIPFNPGTKQGNIYFPYARNANPTELLFHSHKFLVC